MSNPAPSLFSDFMQLQSEYAGLKLWQAKQLELEVLYQNEIAWLTEKLLKARRERFGAMKERWESEEQVILFNEAEVEAGKPDPQGEAADSEVAVTGFK